MLKISLGFWIRLQQSINWFGNTDTFNYFVSSFTNLSYISIDFFSFFTKSSTHFLIFLAVNIFFNNYKRIFSPRTTRYRKKTVIVTVLDSTCTFSPTGSLCILFVGYLSDSGTTCQISFKSEMRILVSTSCFLLV